MLTARRPRSASPRAAPDGNLRSAASPVVARHPVSRRAKQPRQAGKIAWNGLEMTTRVDASAFQPFKPNPGPEGEWWLSLKGLILWHQAATPPEPSAPARPVNALLRTFDPGCGHKQQREDTLPTNARHPVFSEPRSSANPTLTIERHPGRGVSLVRCNVPLAQSPSGSARGLTLSRRLPLGSES